MFFARKISQILDVKITDDVDGRTRNWHVHGPIFFASTQQLWDRFDFQDLPVVARIDLTHAHVWDISGIATLDGIVMRLRKLGVDVEVVGLNEASATLVDRLANHDKVDALDLAPDH